MIIGARLIKTGVAVSITMYLCRLFSLEPAVFGAVSAVLNIQPSVYLTLRTAKDQIVIHILGVAVGLLLGYVLGGNPVSMGLAAVITLLIYRKMNLKTGILMGIVTAIFILGSPQERFLPSVFLRSGVIFTGLTVAMAVNIFLWPPRYHTQFISKVRETNTLAAEYFCTAVKDFVHSDAEKITPPAGLREEYNAAYREASALSKNVKGEAPVDFSVNGLPQKEWFHRAETLLDYSHALVEKADYIYDLTSARVERRVQAGLLPISPEYRSILELLARACSTVQRVNSKLRSVVCDHRVAEAEGISETLWNKLSFMVEKWRPAAGGSYYFHAMIEMGAVAGEIRWAAREGKKILQDFVSPVKE